MREIKFRAWEGRAMIQDYCWLHTDDNRFYAEDLTNTGYHDPIAVMQYTGLKDKNGKDIYEGDIVCTELGNVCMIKWDHVKETSNDDVFEYTGFCFHHIKQAGNYHLDDTSKAEVIGNIYEHSELLKL